MRFSAQWLSDGDLLVERACEIYVLCLHASARQLTIKADDYKESSSLRNVDRGILQLLESIEQ